ncbi:MAG: SRPBCC family protein [Chloroflexi bacterium]|nr:SRPBCC family protein [Chloroflexota bacterium]
MALRIQRQITVNAPPSVVYSYLIDFPRHVEWASSSLSITQTSSGPVEVGSTFVSETSQSKRSQQDQLTVTELEPDSKIVFETEGAAGLSRLYFLIEGTGDGTLLTKGMEGAGEPLFIKIISPVFPVIGKRIGKRLFDGDLQRIKFRIEEMI